jgi:17beta-estradiol 17-dehydrogenase / very-long-chain 3-oxoacyl-CoA reductase
MSLNILKGYPGISVALQYFGLAVFSYYTLKFLFKIFSNLYVFTLGSVNFKKYGKWAVVTGCTDGIGKAYAEKLAKKGLNVVLISRSLDKLNELSESIKSKYNVDTLVISADFTGKKIIFYLNKSFERKFFKNCLFLKIQN